MESSSGRQEARLPYYCRASSISQPEEAAWGIARQRREARSEGLSEFRPDVSAPGSDLEDAWHCLRATLVPQLRDKQLYEHCVATTAALWRDYRCDAATMVRRVAHWHDTGLVRLLYRHNTGTASEIHWDYIGVAQVLHWYNIRTMLVLYAGSMGTTLVRTGSTTLVLYGHYTGTALLQY